MHHYRQVPDVELPTINDDDGRTRSASPRELRDAGFFRVGTADNGDGIYLVPCVDPCQGHPGVELAGGAFDDRHRRLEPEVRGRIMRARVFRGRRGNLRRQVERDERTIVDARRKAPRAIRRRLRDRLAAELNDQRPGAEIRTVDLFTVAADDVLDGDVVDAEDLPPLRMAGER